MADESRLKINLTTISLLAAGSFLMMGLAALYFVKVASHSQRHNQKLKEQLAKVERRLDQLNHSLGELEAYGDRIESSSKKEIGRAKMIAEGSHEGHDHGVAGGVDDMSLAHDEMLFVGNDMELLINEDVAPEDRVSEMILNTRLLSHRFKLLTQTVESRRKILDGIPSLIPTSGRLTSGYGHRKSPFHGRQVRHQGIDIAAPVGSPVYASADGKVVYAGWNKTFGRIVAIKHDFGILTKYAHAAQVVVRKGQAVTRGQVIAQVGNTGRSTGPHLHYEVWVNGKSVNPQKFLIEKPIFQQGLAEVRDVSLMGQGGEGAEEIAAAFTQKIVRTKNAEGERSLTLFDLQFVFNLVGAALLALLIAVVGLLARSRWVTPRT